ncbi:hypothetical protein D3C87_1241900 [compost metagenome]
MGLGMGITNLANVGYRCFLNDKQPRSDSGNDMDQSFCWIWRSYSSKNGWDIVGLGN